MAAFIICGIFGLSPAVSARQPVPELSDGKYEQKVQDIVDEYDDQVTRAQAANNPYISSRLIVKSSDRALDPSDYGAIDAAHDRDDHYILQFRSPKAAEAAQEKLEDEKATVYAEPDIYLFAADVFDRSPDQSVSSWGTARVNADEYSAYLLSTGSGSSDTVRIAVIDSGVNKTHELLSSLIDTEYEKDYVDDDSDASDGYGHGTFVSGIIAQCAGDLNQVKIVPIRILNNNGQTTLSMCINAVNYVYNYVDVINLSMAASISGADAQTAAALESLTECIGNAAGAGCTVVVAAGNGAGDTSGYSPANITDDEVPGCIVVAASTSSDSPAGFSNYGSSVDISAPGASLTSSWYGAAARYKSGANGTSYAAPYVSAAAAMLRLSYPSYTPAQIESALENAADSIVNTSGKSYGSGILNLDPFVSDSFRQVYNTSPDETTDTEAAGGSTATTDADETNADETAVTVTTPDSESTTENTTTSGATSTTVSTSSETNYAGTDPKANVSYRVPLKKKQKITILKVTGLSGGDYVVSWKSSNSRKAKVAGKANGTCIITAGTTTGNTKVTAVTASGKKIVFKLKIQKTAVKTKKLTVKNRKLSLAAGNSVKLSVTRYPISSRQKITYKTSDRSTVKVASGGVIRAVSKGTATVIVTSGAVKINIKVTVK